MPQGDSDEIPWEPAWWWRDLRAMGPICRNKFFVWLLALSSPVYFIHSGSWLPVTLRTLQLTGPLP